MSCDKLIITIIYSVLYQVKCTDKLTSLAALYDTTPSALKNLNKLSVDFLYPDQVSSEVDYWLFISQACSSYCTNIVLKEFYV